jgi:3',5'-cyclic AMP phosphodiesterase CpdA
VRRLVHLSDLHFGRAETAAVEALERSVISLSPHLVVVSGDLTQRAKRSEYLAARAFLDRLAFPRIVVPGNHDVPLYNLFDRFARPLSRFQAYISKDAVSAHIDDEIAVVGVSTARSLTIKGGRINDKQVAELEKRFCGLPDGLLKVVVTHHPFDLPGNEQVPRVGRAQMALPRLAKCGVDVFLAGHMHVSSVMASAKRCQVGGLTALLIQAGTAVSDRSRGESQSFNLIEVDGPHLRVVTMSFMPPCFETSEIKTYRHGITGWERAD